MLKDKLLNLCNQNNNIYELYDELALLNFNDIENIMTPENYKQFLIEYKSIKNQFLFADINIDYENSEYIKDNIKKVLLTLKNNL